MGKRSLWFLPLRNALGAVRMERGFRMLMLLLAVLLMSRSQAQAAEAVYRPLPNGVEVTSGGHMLRLMALTDTLLRVGLRRTTLRLRMRAGPYCLHRAQHR